MLQSINKKAKEATILLLGSFEKQSFSDIINYPKFSIFRTTHTHDICMLYI